MVKPYISMIVFEPEATARIRFNAYACSVTGLYNTFGFFFKGKVESCWG